jgi:16S rRNA (guanine527-N7)-methyltransferase
VRSEVAISLATVGVDGVSAEQIEALDRFRQLLVKWQQVQNLVSRETIDQFWDRHIADSLQLMHYLPEDTKTILDVGSGGGFPAIPLAIICSNREIDFILVESNSRKVAFLRAVSRALDLRVQVTDTRIEDYVSRETMKPDVITARAVASLTQLLHWTAPAWGSETRALFLKGREHVEELTESHGRWVYNVIQHMSRTEPSGVVLEISNLRQIADL